MIKKNVIFITIDELTFNAVDKQFSNGLNTTPFLSELSKKSITTSKMYAQGPYTEMAIRGLLYGSDGLDNLSTMFTRPSHDFAFYKIMRENNYKIETITNFLYQRDMDTQKQYSQLHKNDTWDSLWSTRFYEFENEILNGNANHYEFDICFELLETKFINMIILYDQLCNESTSVSYFQKNFRESKDFYADRHSFFSEELKKLNANKTTYITSFFRDKRFQEFSKKELFSEHQYMQNDELREYAIIKHRKFVKRMRWVNFKLNLKNSRIRISNIRFNFELLKRGQVKNAFTSMKAFLKYYGHVLTDKHICSHKKNDIIVDLTRSEGMFTSFFDFLDSRKDNSPFFCYMQPTDVHVPADIFNVHVSSIAEIDCEYKIAHEFIEMLPKDFKGSVNYYTTVRVLDERLKNFFIELENRGLLENSYVIITGDHGTSCLYDEVRDVLDNTSYDTQYHVPFILFTKGIVPKKIDKLTYSKDIPPTIFSLLELDVPDKFSGNNILDENYQNKYIIQEYMGGGCPNFYKKPARFFIRDLTYKVSYWVMLDSDFKSGEIKEIHNLINDPLETNNLIYSVYDKEKVNEMLEILSKRHAVICKDFLKLKNQ